MLQFVLKNGGGAIRKSNRGDTFDQSTYMHVWKFHNGTPLYN
jgi:hypothetical protein